MTFKQALFEAVKEILRMVFFAILPVILMGINTETGDVTINWRVVIAVGVVTALKSLDKFFYKYDGVKANGITPF